MTTKTVGLTHIITKRL